MAACSPSRSRPAAGLTLAELGRRCGYSASQVSRYERGVQPLTDITLLRRFSQVLAIPPQAFGLTPPGSSRAGQHAVEPKDGDPRARWPRSLTGNPMLVTAWEGRRFFLGWFGPSVCEVVWASGCAGRGTRWLAWDYCATPRAPLSAGCPGVVGLLCAARAPRRSGGLACFDVGQAEVVFPRLPVRRALPVARDLVSVIGDLAGVTLPEARCLAP